MTAEGGLSHHSSAYNFGQNGDPTTTQQPQDRLDIQHAAARMIAPQYDYGHNLSAQQPPILDTSLELELQRPYSVCAHYSIQSRTQMDFHNPSPVSSRMIDFRYSPPSSSERRFPDNHSPSVITHIESPLAASLSSSKTMRNQIPSVVIACRQCHAHKIRCDSTRPVCDNCTRKAHDCEYDEKPRRRGPDKRPGTRQRSHKKRPTDGSALPPKRQKTATERLSEKDEDLQSNPLESPPSSGTVKRYSPRFYHSTIHPAAHAHPPISAGVRSSEPNPHPKVRQQLLLLYPLPQICPKRKHTYNVIPSTTSTPECDDEDK